MDSSNIPQMTIANLREFSRKLVRELGFMRPSLAGTNLAPSAVHAVIEIGRSPGIQARDLAATLRLDKSNASRQLSRLESLGLIERNASSEDGRSLKLFLTPAGKEMLAKIDAFATDQVSNALQRLAPDDQKALVRFLSLYSDALAVDNPNVVREEALPIESHIHKGYVPGCIGDIAGLHARYYAKKSGFGVYFEKKVATELSRFAGMLPSPDKAIWLYMEEDRTLGSIVIDGDAEKNMAHLRWFIVDDALRGTGVGRYLLDCAMAFADQRFDQTYLWTFQGLLAARHLYESVGFQLAEELAGEQWGARVIEQRFVRRSKKSKG